VDGSDDSGTAFHRKGDHDVGDDQAVPAQRRREGPSDGRDPRTNAPHAYIGEAEVLRERLKQHN
jgi:hypothetical protein